jgi:hypothetical protein
VIFTSIYGINQAKISKVIDIDALLKNHDDLVSSQLYCLNSTLVAEFAYALLLIVVPEQDFIYRKLGISSAAHERQNITPE